jgi:hypothetical protein
MSPFPFRRKPVVSGTPSGVVVCTACGKPSPGLLSDPLGLCAVCRHALTALSFTVNQASVKLNSLTGTLSFGGNLVQNITFSDTFRLEAVEQDDLLQGTKYATLWMTKDGKPSFRGTGYCSLKSEYSTESYASCGEGYSHNAPAADCKCGFWIPTEKSALSVWHRPYVRLEVEFGGRVLDCGRDPLPAPARGWRAPVAAGPVGDALAGLRGAQRVQPQARDPGH